jgi:hypothetical protein
MKKYTPLPAGIAFVTIVVGALEWLALKKTGGHFCYPLDDPFIHMALAKNVALHGNWGINANDWTSTSSSPLFTILLSLLFKVFSINVYMPMVLSCGGTLLALVVMQRELNRHSSLTTVNQGLLIIGTIIIGTIPAMTLLGMEHTLQIAFVLLFVHAVASVLTSAKGEPPREGDPPFAGHRVGRPPGAAHPMMDWTLVWQASLCAGLMTFTRYETSFLVAGAFLMLVLQRKFKAAVIIALAGALPIILFGLVSVSKGAYFIPNSVMIKGNQNITYLLNGGVTIIEKTGAFAGLFVIALLLAWQKIRVDNKDRDFWILCLFLFGAAMHAITVTLSWFYRYEAYLIVLGTLHVGKMLLYWLQENGWRGVRRQCAVFVITLALLYSLPVRGLNSLRNSVRAIYNIYEQQYQMGLFLKTYYYQQTVAANDIGAISYYADLNTIDLWGLGNNQVMKARKYQYWNNGFLQGLVHDTHTRVAVIYDSWFDKDLSKPWYKVATWELPYVYSCGDIKVSFYGMTNAEADTLEGNLKTFQAQLPKDVKVEYSR